MQNASPTVSKRNVLELFNSSIILDGQQRTVDGVFVLGGGSILAMKYDNHLMTFRYEEAESNFKVVNVEYNKFDADINSETWYFPKHELIVLKKANSFQSFRFENDNWIEFAGDFNNRDYKELFLGKFSDANAVLEAVIQDDRGWKFMMLNDGRWNIKPIQFPAEWTRTDSKVEVLSSFDTIHDVFMLRTSNILRFYSVNASLQVECIVNDVQLSENHNYERIEFANLFNAKHKEMLHFSSVGLNVYRFEDATNSYKPMYYTTSFSEFRMWNADYVNSLIVHDIDNDGIDELLLTSPSGLQVYQKAEYDNDFFLKDVLLKTDNYALRFMTLKAIMVDDQHKMRFILHDERRLFLVNFRSTTEMLSILPEKEYKEDTQQNVSLVTPATNYTRWLHEQLDLSDLLQPLNSLTGNVELSIPLVQIDNPFGISVRKVLQYRDIEGDRFLASGWTFPLDYITVDWQNSILEENYRYSIIMHNNQMTLIQNFDLSTNEVIHFDVQNELVFKYFRKHERWVMESLGESMRYIFGTYNSSRALQFAEKDKNEQYPIGWYLLREEDSTNSYVQYAYKIDWNNVYLIDIKTNMDSSVRFNYDNGQMRNITVQTQSYKQLIDLMYTREGERSKVFLTEIRQDEHTFFEFQYDPSYKMVKIVYPNGLESILKYESLEITNKNQNRLELLDKDFSLNYGPDYSVIVQMVPDRSEARFEVRDLLGGPLTIKKFTGKIIARDSNLINYQVVVLDNLFGIIVALKTQKIANFYQFQNKEWHHIEYSLSSDAIVMANTNLIFIMDKGVLKTIYVNNEGVLDVHLQSVPINTVIHATNRGILSYDDDELFLRNSFTNSYFQWKYQVKGLIQLMYATVNRFRLNAETRTNLCRALKLDMLQLYNNSIILRTLEINKSGHFIIRLKINRLDTNHELLQDDNWRIYLGPVDKMSLKAKSAAGDVCVIRYLLQGNEYVADIKTCEGPTITTIENDFQKEISYIESTGRDVDKIVETAKSIVKYSNRRGEFEKQMLEENPFAFDVSILGISIDQSGIRTGGKIVSFNGTHWNQRNQEKRVNLELSDGLMLTKLDNTLDTFKVTKNDTILFDSKTSDGSSVKLVWPYYFASQPKRGPPLLYLFKSNETIQMESHEKLSSFSNNIVIVTTNTVTRTLILRPVKNYFHATKTVLANQTLELSANERRITTYEHIEMVLDAMSNGYVFTCSRIIPGGDAKKFGWYEHRYDPVSREMSRIISDGSGSFIKNVNPEINESYEKPNSTVVITDKTGRLPIVDVSPMNVGDGEYSYYGFEAYERIVFEDKNRWKFSDSFLVTENDNRYLRLENGNSRFEGILRMKNPNETYIFSCWLRTNSLLRIGDEIHLVTIELEEIDKTDVEIGKTTIQNYLHDWFYVELLIKTKDIRYDLTVNLIIATTDQMVFCIDNIRFSPMSVDFKAYIYRPSYSTVSAVLHNNGLITQYLLDSHGNRVVFVSDSGKVTNFITYSKTYHIRNSEILPHVMEIRPRDGTLENFKNSFRKGNWKAVNESAWELQSGRLIHKSVEQDPLKRSVSAMCDMIVVRFVYNVHSNDAVIQLMVSGSKITDFCRSFQNKCAAGNAADYGEIVVYVSRTHKAVWFEGTLVYEVSHSIRDLNEFGLIVTGSVTISEMLILYDPSIKITYYNRLGLPRQTLILQDDGSVRIKEALYDDIDRSTINTKWTTVKKNGDLLFGFHENFITGVKSSELEGLVDQLNPKCEGFPYFRKDYANNPTPSEAVISMPGKLFSTNQKYFRHISQRSNITILNILFPPEHGYMQQVETRQNISYHVIINNAKGQKVAYYVQVDDFDRRLTSYEYDGDKLILELPPMYHKMAASLDRSKPFWDGNRTIEDIQLQQQWGIRYTYNDNGQMTSKRMPDSGIHRFIYDGDVVRFLLHMDGNTTDKTVFLSYGVTGKIVKEGIVDNIDEFPNISGNSTIQSSNYAEYYHGEFDSSPNIRHRSQQSIRRISDKQMLESLLFDNNDRIIKKIHVVPALNTSYSIDYTYMNDKLAIIRYPIDINGSDFKLKYSYNNAGDMISIGTWSNSVQFAKLEYNADGLVREIQFEPWTAFSYKREFNYNEPGYLTGITDMFLDEHVSYLEVDGYGSSYSMIFEGLISKTSFTARWHQRSNPVLSRLYLSRVDDIDKGTIEYCLKRLLQLGYFDERLKPLKSFYPELDDTISKMCRSKQLRRIIHAHGFSFKYGHSYEYDSHEQLVKAKYFQSEPEASWKPLVETTFSTEIDEVDDNASRKIWNILIDSGFVELNCYTPGRCEGFPGNKSLFHDLIPKKTFVQALLVNAIAETQSISSVNFAKKCSGWNENSPNNNCSETWKQLLAHNFVGANSNKTQNALNPSFRKSLSTYSTYVPKIVHLLNRHFATRLGGSPGDILSCRFDANGNHRLFKRGFERYLFTYKDGCNQINTVVKSDADDASNSKTYLMKHNSEGSVIAAEHKGIRKIEYDPLLNRPSKIELIDGRLLKFEYDVRGERTFKQVLDKNGNISNEKYYIRDLNRNVLVDLQLTFVAKNKSPDLQLTSYVYSNRGLVGFIRNNEFYSVFFDHERSTRLVIKNGEVKAAYDYLPFGTFFRKFEENVDGMISYLYTGQEWDEETGLYNYHTRLYDPEIGRFFQIDPKNQYPSPYVYAGNSPVTLIDPDGQFFMLLVAIALAIVGAYLGAAAANGSWNPAEWDWRSSNTWLSIISGALSGATLPFTAGSTLTYFTSTLGLSFSTSVSIMVGSGIGFTYFSMAAANNNWNPSEWDIKSPITWNAFFKGISTSVSVLKNPYTLVSSYNGISTVVGKGLFIGGKIVLTTGFAYMFAVMQQNGEFDPSNWDFSKLGLYLSMFDGAMQATSTVTFVTNLPKQVNKWITKISSALDRLDEIDAFLKYNRHVGADWSKKFSDVKYFLKANSANFNAIGRSSFNVFLYTTISSLRLSRIIEKSAVPEFDIMIEYIKAIQKVGSFTDKFVNELVPSYATDNNIIFRELHDDIIIPEYSALTSSASKIFVSILDFIYFRFAKVDQDQHPDESDIKLYTPRYHKIGKLFSISNCYYFKDVEKTISFIQCYGNKSRVMIHFDPPNDGIVEDVYSSCYPVTHNLLPSVSCEGEKSSLLFTPHDKLKIFDFLDGWILLARVLPTAIKIIAKGVISIFNDDVYQNCTVQKHEVENVAMQVNKLDSSIKANILSTWAEKALEELKEDVADFFVSPKRDLGTYRALEERIIAMQEDILEEWEHRISRNNSQVDNIVVKLPVYDIFKPSTVECWIHENNMMLNQEKIMLS